METAAPLSRPRSPGRSPVVTDTRSVDADHEVVTPSSTIRGEVVVPGSVANLGGGFDTLGVAVQLYLRARIVNVRDDGAARLTVTTSTPPVRGQNAVERAFEAIARR